MNHNQPEENVVSGLYDNYHETQKEILAIEIRKTRNKLLALAAVAFISDFLALLVANTVQPVTLLAIAVIPLILAGLSFLSLKEPLTAIIIAAVIILAAWIYAAVVTGGMAAISGWLIKAIIVYLLIAGFQSAKEAHKIRKEIKG